MPGAAAHRPHRTSIYIYYKATVSSVVITIIFSFLYCHPYAQSLTVHLRLIYLASTFHLPRAKGILTLRAVVLGIPLGKVSESLAQGDSGSKSKIALQCLRVGISHGHIAGLHGHQLLVGLKVIVLRQHAGTDELLLQDVHKVQQVLGLTATDVVNSVRWYWQAIFACLLRWRFLHYSIDTFNNVVHIRKVSTAVTIVEDLNGLTFQKLIGKTEVGHIRSACRSVNGEEPQTG